MRRVRPGGMARLALRCILGGIFVYAGCEKIGNPKAFADSIAAYQMLPPRAVLTVALGLPYYEIVAGGWLIIGWERRASALSIMLLSGIFLLALGQALARGLNIDCGCFGSDVASRWQLLIAMGRDALLMAAAFILYRAEDRIKDSEAAGAGIWAVE